jgi:hypothetical protein
MANITGPKFITANDLYSSNSVKPSGFELGDLAWGSNGKAYRLALFGETGVVGDIYQSSVVDTQFTEMAVAANVAAGQESVVLTNGTTAVTANQFDGGSFAVAVTPGLGDEYTIVGHSTATNGSALTVYLDRPLRTAITAAASKVTLRRSPWSGVVKCPTTLTGTVVGVGLYAVTSGEYGWLQTKGVAAVLSDNSTGAVGSDVGVPGATAGSVGVNVAGTGKSNTVGRAMSALSSGKVVQVQLCID